jgi:hypothetical protein
VALGLDADGDGAITWGEVRTRHADIAALACSTCSSAPTARPAPLSVGEQQVDEHTDGAYTVLPLALACPPGAAHAGPCATRCLPTWTRQHRGLLG